MDIQSSENIFTNVCELSYLCFVYYRCHSMREEKLRKEEEEKEAWKRAEEEERTRREEEEEARRKAEEEEERRRMEAEEKARRKAEEENARKIAEEEEAARKKQEAQKKREEAETSEPQTREDPDIELVTEEMLDDNLPVQETEEERGEEPGEVNTSSHTEEEQGKDEELEDEELDLETNGTMAEAGPQLDEKEEEDLENQVLEQSDSKPVRPSDGVNSNAQAPSDTPSNADQKRVRPPAINRGQSSRSQEKREQRRQRGLEHNQRETERASSSASGKDQPSPPKSKSQEASKLKERADSKELDQYTFVAWKMKEDKGGKKEAKTSLPTAGPVRPSTLSLQPTDPVPERNGVGESAGPVNLHRRPGAIKEKPEKWRGRRSDGELPDSTSPPSLHSKEEKRKKQTLYVFCSDHILRSTFMF